MKRPRSPQSEQPGRDIQPRQLSDDSGSEETDEPEEVYSPLCNECVTLFTDSESAKFRDALARLPSRNIRHKNTLEATEAERGRQSLIESFTLAEMVHNSPTSPTTQNEIKIEFQFSRSRGSLVRRAFSCGICQYLSCFLNKELLSIINRVPKSRDDVIESRDKFDHFIHKEQKAAEASSASNLTCIFEIQVCHHKSWDIVYLSHQNYDQHEHLEIPRLELHFRAPIGDISSRSIPWIGYSSFEGSLPVPIQREIEDLLRACDRTHQKCSELHSTFDTMTPSWILNLVPDSKADPPDWIKLEEFGETCRPYATLSYCWGGDQETRTTLSSLERYKSGIRVPDLPLTIQHAITVARSLKIQHLWVDSLCIIQDSAASLGKEIAKMAGIYNGSYLTILPVSAASCQVGFLGDDDLGIALRLPYECHNGEVGTVCLRTGGKVKLSPWQQPAESRAWIYQEQFLSPRTLEFREGGIVFTCRITEFMMRPEPEDEDGDDDRIGFSTAGPRNEWRFYNRTLEIQRLRDSFADQQSLSFIWEEVLCKYSTRILSREEDKLPALSSIAHLYAKATGDQYLAGLWQSRLPHLLLWRRPYFEFKKPSHWRAPSWSPLSVDGPILFGLPMRHALNEASDEPEENIRFLRRRGNESSIAKCNFIKADIDLRFTEAPYSSITKAILEVKGKLVHYPRDPESSLRSFGASSFLSTASSCAERWDVLMPSSDSKARKTKSNTPQSHLHDTRAVIRRIMNFRCMINTFPLADELEAEFLSTITPLEVEAGSHLDIYAFLACEIIHEKVLYFGCILVMRVGDQKFQRIGTYFAKQSVTRQELDDELEGAPSWQDFSEAEEETIVLI